MDSIRPDYDYAEYQKELADLEGKLRTVKHAMNETIQIFSGRNSQGSDVLLDLSGVAFAFVKFVEYLCQKFSPDSNPP